MGKQWHAPGGRSQWTIATLFLATASGALYCAVIDGYDFLPSRMSSWDRPLHLAAQLSPLLILSAAVLIFWRPRAGCWLAIVAGTMALSWIAHTEYLASWGSWTFLNTSDPAEAVEASLIFPSLMILSTALAVMTISSASMHLLPAQWLIRGRPLRQRVWPTIAMGFLVVGAWFLHSATPYSVPGFDHPLHAQLRILHVQKHGLRFDETTVSEFRNGQVWAWRVSRNLLQYRFEQQATTTSLAETSTVALERARALVQSPELWKLRTLPPKALLSWNAEGWYVVLKDSQLLAFTTENGTKPPHEVTVVFQELDALTVSEPRTFTLRDVCLGFCYDPVAALGFTILPQRQRLLAGSTSLAARR